MNTNEKDDTSEDDKKQRIINSELIPLHARWLEHTAIQRGEGGLVWRWRWLEDYSFSGLLFKDRNQLCKAVDLKQTETQLPLKQMSLTARGSKSLTRS